MTEECHRCHETEPLVAHIDQQSNEIIKLSEALRMARADLMSARQVEWLSWMDSE
jgi:hypothetical protein